MAKVSVPKRWRRRLCGCGRPASPKLHQLRLGELDILADKLRAKIQDFIIKRLPRLPRKLARQARAGSASHQNMNPCSRPTDGPTSFTAAPVAANSATMEELQVPSKEEQPRAGCGEAVATEGLRPSRFLICLGGYKSEQTYAKKLAEMAVTLLRRHQLLMRSNYRKIIQRWRELLGRLLNPGWQALMYCYMYGRALLIKRENTQRWRKLLGPLLNLGRQALVYRLCRKVASRQCWCHLLVAWQQRRCEHDLFLLRMQALLHNRKSQADKSKEMVISVRHANEKEVRVTVWSNEKVSTVVTQALGDVALQSAREGVLVEGRVCVFDKCWLDYFFFKCNGALAERDRTLAECGIRQNATIVVVVRTFRCLFIVVHISRAFVCV